MLSIALSIAFLAPFHHHDHQFSQEISCLECANHQPHQGHFSQKTISDECLICHILSQVYVPAVGLDADILSPDCVTLVSDCFGVALLRYTLQSSPRAPPVSFCF